MQAFRSIFHRELWTKELISWYFYDFANSLFVVNASLYFSQWVTIDHHLPDFFFGLPFVLATALLVFISPYFGEMGDRNGSHHRILVFSTFFAVAASFFTYFIGIISSSMFGVVLALMGYGLFNLLYQLALVPYSAFLKLISSEGMYGKVSGLGFAANQLGYVAGILLTYPIVMRTHSHISPLLPAAFGFFIFSMPALFLLRSVKINKTYQPVNSVLGSLKENLSYARNYPGMIRFLISFYLWSDATLSLSLYGAIFLENVFHLPDALKATIFLIVVVAETLGSFLGGILSDHLGHKRILIVSLFFTALSIIPLALLHAIRAAEIIFPVFGFMAGLSFASARSYFATLFPTLESGKFFGLYTFSERAASVFGPIIWGVIVFTLSAHAPWNYRIATLFMSFIIFMSIIPLASFSRFDILKK